MGVGDVGQNTVFGVVNIERKKYDPIYEILVNVGNKPVIYIGRLYAFGTLNALLTVKGIVIPKATVKTHEAAEKILDNQENEEVTFPAVAFMQIRKLPKKDS